MLKVNKQLAFKVRVGSKQGPTNVSPYEQRIYKMGYRIIGEKISNVYTSGWMKNKSKRGKMFRIRTYFRGMKSLRVVDIINDIRDVSVSI